MVRESFPELPLLRDFFMKSGLALFGRFEKRRRFWAVSIFKDPFGPVLKRPFLSNFRVAIDLGYRSNRFGRLFPNFPFRGFSGKSAWSRLAGI